MDLTIALIEVWEFFIKELRSETDIFLKIRRFFYKTLPAIKVNFLDIELLLNKDIMQDIPEFYTKNPLAYSLPTIFF